MKITCGLHFGGKAKELVRGPRVAINAAVLAAAIRIEARLKTDVRAVVARDDSLAVVLEKLRARSLRTATIRVIFGIPIFIAFEMDFLEPVRRIFRRAAMR
jgi:hypothetical protein